MAEIKPVNISDSSVIMLGNTFVPIYLVKGKELALVEGGISMMWPSVKTQLASIGILPQMISYLVLLHSHLDHTGMAKPAKKEFLNIRIAASRETAEELSKDVNPDIVRAMDETFEEILNLRTPEEYKSFAEEKVNLDLVMEDKSVLDLGNGVELEFIKAPGHSPCSSCVYIKKNKTLFISDATGFLLSGTDVMPTFFYDYRKFISSLDKLSQYDAETICLGHHAVLRGSETEGFFKKVKEEALRFKDIVLENRGKGMDNEGIVGLVRERYKKGNIADMSDAFFGFSVYSMINILVNEVTPV